MFPKGFEWVVILIVALLIFGPKNLPKLGKSLGKTVKNIREGMSGDGEQQAEEAEVVEEDDEVAQLEAQLAEAKAKKEAAAAMTPSNRVHKVDRGRLTARVRGSLAVISAHTR